MASLSTIAPGSHLTSLAAMESSCTNLSSRAVIAAKRTPSFTVGKGVPLLLRKQSNDSTVACNAGGKLPTCSLHGLESRARPASSAHSAGRIGIAEFLGGKNFLITGGTGFLAKVLIEKILRTNTDVGKIYIMIKAKDTEAALKRLQNEVYVLFVASAFVACARIILAVNTDDHSFLRDVKVVDTELFKCLQKIHGKNYHSFVARKLIPVVGDVRENNLGIAPELAGEIAKEVDIIVNSAGNTNFHERYDVAMDINTLGPFRIMCFAQRFQRLKLFLHVSTAYVNGKRQGVVVEKPFRLGDTIAKELGSDSSHHKGGAVLDIEAEFKLAFDSRRHFGDSASFSQEIKDLGLERARFHGWQDTYVFTKAMGEMVINCMRGEIPVVTIRPSVIESTLSDPFPGWIQGNRMVDPVIINYGKGHMTTFLGDPDCVFDVIPADMVVNATLASMAKHGGARGAGAGMHVYHVSSSTVNPLVYNDLFQFFFQHFARSPIINAERQPIPVQPMRFCDSMEQYTSDVEMNMLLRSSRGSASSERLLKRARDLRAKTIEHVIHLGRIYEPYTFYGGRFDSANTEALFMEMSEEERARFHFDARSIDWMDYFTEVHIPGVRKHVMKGRSLATKPLLSGTSV